MTSRAERVRPLPQSDGGLARMDQFSGFRAVLSGPAGGVVGYSRTTFDYARQQLRARAAAEAKAASSDGDRQRILAAASEAEKQLPVPAAVIGFDMVRSPAQSAKVLSERSFAFAGWDQHGCVTL